MTNINKKKRESSKRIRILIKLNDRFNSFNYYKTTSLNYNAGHCIFSKITLNPII